NAYSQAISLDKHYIAAIYNRGNAYIKINKDDLALKDLNKAIELDANFYQAYYNRGTLHKRMGNTTQAQQDLAKAKELAQQELEIKTQH
ncbi:MAG: tetratricopeptide repeat protein, partial [Candidatus Thioglobus sp.]|nr:tetratricopeptide repeat protein [Candidatus Thioglobus sp.]